jgi:hypothetical protein
MATDPKPMTRQTFRRLMASADTPEAEMAQRLNEARANGALWAARIVRGFLR